MDKRDLKRIHPALPSLVKHLKNQPASRREFLRTSTLLGLSAAGAYTLAGQILGTGSMPMAHAQNTAGDGKQILRVAMDVRDGITDPAVYEFTEMAMITRHFCQYLTIAGVDGITRPYLAERWEASEDLKTWTFFLRRDVQWHNGDTFDADDVLFNLTRWLDPDLGSANMGSFGSLTETFTYGGVSAKRKRSGSVVKLDRFTVQLNLSQPSLSIPENFTAYFAAIVHRDFTGDIMEAPVGTGPYRLAEYEPGNKAILVRSGRPYWGDDPALDEIHYLDKGGNPAERIQALARSEVDMVYSIDTRSLDLGNRLPETTIYEIESAATGVARMNVNNPPFDDINVRKAIQACVDPLAYPRQIFKGRGGAAEHHHVSPMHPEYYELPRPQQDYDKARELLARAGYSLGLNLTIDCGNTNGLWQQFICEVLKDQLAPAGINLTVNVISKSEYWAEWTTRPFGITTWGHRNLGTMVLSLAYRAGVPWNETGYDNPKFDAALDRAESLIDIPARTEAMKEVQQILQDDAIIIQPVWRPAYFIARNYVNGLEPNPTRMHDFDGVSIDNAAKA